MKNLYLLFVLALVFGNFACKSTAKVPQDTNAATQKMQEMQQSSSIS